MSRWQRLESGDEVLELRVGSTDTHAPTEVLQHVDAGPAVRRIHHEMHGPVRFEHAAKSSEPRIGVGKMMEYPGADDVIEASSQLVYPIDGELMDLETAQVVLSLEFLGTAYAGRAEIDTGNPSPRPSQGIPRRLRCAASRNEDGVVFPMGKSGPEKMMVGAMFLWVLPEPSVVLEAVDRRRIRVPFVKILDSRRHPTG